MSNFAKSIPIHTESDFEGMRKAGKFAASVLDMILEFVKVGVTTNKINEICHEYIVSHNAIPAPLGYKGSGGNPFPKSLCTSVNNVVCHGIPSEYKLQEGDSVAIDVTTIIDGWHGDTCRTFFVGDSFLDKKQHQVAKKLTKVTYEAMMLAINSVKPGERLSKIGVVIQEHAKKHGFSVVQDFCGHGIGKKFHTDPMVPHYFGLDVAPYTNNVILQKGMFFTIEPMINAGKYHIVVSKKDHWTATTKDNSLSAQFEHTIGVTDTGFEIFTLSQNGTGYPKILDDFKL